ncbi:MAG TPA: hypothetical protein VM580_28295 [Labilithrix sp.]|nr:hypothetical protein [Labilithrix sp.]
MTRPHGDLARRTLPRAAHFALLAALATLASRAEAEPRQKTEPRPKSQGQPLSNEARADQLFRSGEKKFDAGDYAGACTDFSESLKLGPKLGALLNLALCHETIGKFVTAWSEFSHAAVWAAQNGQRDRHDFAIQHARALEPKLPRVILQLPTDRAIDGLDLDGEPVPETRWYMPLFLDPGEHHLAVTAPGKQRTTIAFRVTASASDQFVYVPRLADKVPVPAAPAKPAKPTEPPVDRSRCLLGLVGLGVGGASTLVGLTLGALAMAADERDPAVQGYATGATVAFVAGAAFAATGGWLVWTSTRGTTRAAVTASPRREGVGLSLTTTF